MIEVNVFSAPSGNVRGVASASMKIGNKEEVVVSATLMVDGSCDVALKSAARKCRTLQEASALAAVLNEFVSKLMSS